MSQSQPTVSVIIPAKEAAEALPLALESIAAQTYPNIIEVIVATADPATAKVATSGDAEVVSNPTSTTPAGLNLAIKASSGDVVVRCDVSSLLPPDYIVRAVATLQRTGADNVGGMQVPVGETKWETAIGAAMSSPVGAGDARYRLGGEEGSVETVYLGVFSRDILERLGGYDEAFIRTQDYELNHRIIESGGTVWFDPELRVEYRPRGSLRALATQYYEYGRAKRQMARKHAGSLRWRQLVVPAFGVLLLTSLIISLWYPMALLFPATYLTLLVASSRLSLGRGSGIVVASAAALITIHLGWAIGFFVGQITD